MDIEINFNYIVYQYTNITKENTEYGFTYTGKTKREKRRRYEHEKTNNTNKHMKKARLRGDKFEYVILKRFPTFSYRAIDADTDETQERIQKYLQEVHKCECDLTPSLWPDGAYNIKDEEVTRSFRKFMLQAKQEMYDNKWDLVIAPSFVEYYNDHGEVWTIPVNHPILGKVVNHMRVRGDFLGTNSQSGAQRLLWLKNMKWSNSYDGGKIEYIIKPNFLKYYNDHKTLWSVPSNHPILGAIVLRIRSRGAYIGGWDANAPPNDENKKIKLWLEKKGVAYHTRDLKLHIKRWKMWKETDEVSVAEEERRWRKCRADAMYRKKATRSNALADQDLLRTLVLKFIETEKSSHSKFAKLVGYHQPCLSAWLRKEKNMSPIFLTDVKLFLMKHGLIDYSPELDTANKERKLRKEADPDQIKLRTVVIAFIETQKITRIWFSDLVDVGQGVLGNWLNEKTFIRNRDAIEMFLIQRGLIDRSGRMTNAAEKMVEDAAKMKCESKAIVKKPNSNSDNLRIKARAYMEEKKFRNKTEKARKFAKLTGVNERSIYKWFYSSRGLRPEFRRAVDTFLSDCSSATCSC